MGERDDVGSAADRDTDRDTNRNTDPGAGRAAGSDVPLDDRLDAALDAGERLDFDGFFESHHAALVRALAVALGDDELGRDAAAEGFARALQKWRTISRYDRPAGWVYRVGLNWGRSRRRKTAREVAAWNPELGVDGRTEPTASAPEPNLRLRAALAELSAEHRAVVVARYVLDWSEADIAAALDIAPGTVKSRLHRALDRLATLVPPS